MNSKQVTEGEMATKITEALESKKEKIVLIKADEEVEYGAVMAAMDQLRQAGTVAEVWVVADRAPLECALARAVAALPGARLSPRFGSSDCRCPGHLVSFSRRPALGGVWPGLALITVPISARRGPAQHGRFGGVLLQPAPHLGAIGGLLGCVVEVHGSSFG